LRERTELGLEHGVRDRASAWDRRGSDFAGVRGDVGIQVRQNARQVRRGVLRSAVDELGRALESLAQSESLAGVWVRGLQGYDQLPSEEKARFSSFSMHLFKLFEELYLLHLDGSFERDMWMYYEAAVADIVSHPGFQEWWLTRRHWLNPDYVRLVEARMQKASAPLYRGPTETIVQPSAPRA